LLPFSLDENQIMNCRILADLVVFLHFLFVVFALFGAFLALKWQKTMWIQLPAALWAMAVEYAHLPCPRHPRRKMAHPQGRA